LNFGRVACIFLVSPLNEFAEERIILRSLN
jgi:hypothetical protein